MPDTPKALYGIRRTARELVDGTIRVQIDIEPKNRKAFNELLGEIDMPVALAPLNPSAIAEPPQPRATVSLAQRLHINGYFRNPKLWRALHEKGIYTLVTHKHFVQTQPCIMRGHKPGCMGEVCLHHCTSASIPAAGPELQPDHPNKVPHWYGVPLCVNHHRNWVHSGGATREDKEDLLAQAVALMAERAKEAIKAHYGLVSLADLDEALLNEIEQDLGVGRHAAA